ncbi:hypothetical protein NVIRENTERO_02440 [Sodalis praecaptivus]|nr:hypothetical protein NVIRENTERO_02440 [Sodalis praecaptivus]
MAPNAYSHGVLANPLYARLPPSHALKASTEAFLACHVY